MLDQADGASVVVVDYSCPDGSGDWVEANHPTARLVRVPGRPQFNASEARNIGARHADGPWIAFVDSDVVLDPGFTAAVAPALEPGGFYRARSDDRGLGGTFVCSRADFERVGGYDEVYPCWGEEDNDLFDAFQFVGVEQRVPGFAAPAPPARRRGADAVLPHHRQDARTRDQPGLSHPQVGHGPAAPRVPDPGDAPRPL